MGFVLTAFFLSLFVEFEVQTSLTPQDTRWVGNWWLGFAIFGGISVFWSLWLFAFPKEFPLTKRRREEARPERSASEDVGCIQKVMQVYRDLLVPYSPALSTVKRGSRAQFPSKLSLINILNF